MKSNRIEALFLKYYYNMKRNLDRIFDIFYWPAVGLFTWGFTSMFIDDISDGGGYIGFFLSAFVLWTLVQRSQQDLSTALLEDFWNDNIYNTFSSPITNLDLFVATTLYSVARALVAFLFLFLLGMVFYSFNIFDLGLISLSILGGTLVLFGSAIGAFVSGLIYRFGQRIQVFAWSTIVILQPISAVFYPRDILPGLFYYSSYLVPTSYVFEGMRVVLDTGETPWTHISISLGMTMVYLFIGYAVFAHLLEKSRQKGYLAQYA